MGGLLRTGIIVDVFLRKTDEAKKGIAWVGREGMPGAACFWQRAMWEKEGNQVWKALKCWPEEFGHDALC